MAYATVAQYEALYGPYGDDDMLAAWLDRASRFVDTEVKPYGITIEGDLLTVAADVVCSVVKRVLPSEGSVDLPVGMTQFSMTAGSYTQFGSFPSGYGEMYLNKSEKSQLGMNATQATYHFRG